MAFADDIRVVHPVEIDVHSTPARAAEKFLSLAVKVAHLLSRELAVEEQPNFRLGFEERDHAKDELPHDEEPSAHLLVTNRKRQALSEDHMRHPAHGLFHDRQTEFHRGM